MLVGPCFTHMHAVRVWVEPPYRLTGRKFSDLLNTLALSSLGYTPQLFGSGDFQNVTVIFDLLYTSGGKVLILDSAHLALAQASDATIPVPHFPPLGEQDFALAIEKNDLLTLEVESLPAVGPDDLAIMFHSSGTTGGMPKIIPNTYKMMHAVITGKLFTDLPQEENPKQITVNTIGSVAHIAAFHGTASSFAPIAVKYADVDNLQSSAERCMWGLAWHRHQA